MPSYLQLYSYVFQDAIAEAELKKGELEKEIIETTAATAQEAAWQLIPTPPVFIESEECLKESLKKQTEECLSEAVAYMKELMEQVWKRRPQFILNQDSCHRHQNTT